MTNSFLLTWNPQQKPRSWREEAAKTAKGIACPYWWSTGMRSNIQPGDRLFLLKQGSEPRGIMASGTAVSEVYDDKHWDPQRAKAGARALYVHLKFDRVLDPESEAILPLSVMKQKLAEQHWDTRASGISLDRVAEKLEGLWRSHLWNIGHKMPNGDDAAATEGEQQEALRRHRRREATLRRKKIAQVLRNEGKLQCEVPGCGFNFLEVYGEIGRGFAEVHHLLPLGDLGRPAPTQLGDLAIVCPNCHAMIHRGRQNRPLMGLIQGFHEKRTEH